MEPGCSKHPEVFALKKYNKNKRYNKNYNLYPVRITSTSRLLEYIQQRRLTDSLEWLEKLGYSKEQSVVVLESVQLVAGLEVAA